MKGQMNIFEYMPVSYKGDISRMTAGEIAENVGAALGIVFKPGEKSEEWADVDYVYKTKKYILTIHKSRYIIPPHTYFIGCGYDCPKDKSGSGGPCDSIKEAVEWFRNRLRE